MWLLGLLNAVLDRQRRGRHSYMALLLSCYEHNMALEMKTNTETYE